MVTTGDIAYEVDRTTMIGRLALPDGDGYLRHLAYPCTNAASR